MSVRSLGGLADLQKAGADGPISRVIIAPHSQFRGLFHGLINGLARSGSELLIVTATPQQIDYWKSALSHLDRVRFACNNVRYQKAREPVVDEAVLMERARTYEAKFGLTINRLAVRDRHLGRGYAPGGFRHPRSQISEGTSYAQMVAAFVADIELWEQTIAQFRPTLVVNCGEIANLICTSRGVPFRRLAGSRTENFYQWAHSEYFDNPAIHAAFATLAGQFETHILAKPYKANEMFVTNFGERHGVLKLAKKTAYMAAQHAYWKVRGYEKAKGYHFGENALLPWRQRWIYNDMMGGNALQLKALDGEKFVFFPLQTEPETALQGLSPEYPFQLEAIISLSRDLPAGMLLAVKDTPIALGRRPRDFYRQIRELKNTVFLDIRERGVDVINAAAAVATICGTAGFEGAIIGKPVIVFGAHNPYDILSHVFRVGRDGTLVDGLKKALSPEFDAAWARSEGARYLEAVRRISFRLDKVDVFNTDASSSGEAEIVLQTLIESAQLAAPVSSQP